MANPEHLEILKQGVKAWNRWRRRRPAVGPDLSGADLRGAQLSKANFSLALKNKYVAVGAVMAGQEPDEVVEQGQALRADLRQANLAEAHLSEANLLGADLRGADLRSAYLEGARMVTAKLNKAGLQKAILGRTSLHQADLRGANLSEAYLGEADLYRAWLEGANLAGARLYRANLSEAGLRDVDFREADLTGANFCGAHLEGANFDRARISSTTFVFTNLSGAKGLETATFLGRSSVGVETFHRSEGNIPEAFLRGCGLKDWEIEASKLYRTDLTREQIVELTYKVIELRTDPLIQFNSCFISYSSRDEEFARRLHSDLQRSGVRCWFAPEDMKIGDRIRPRLDDSIRLHDKLLLVLSEASVASQWIEQEVETALERERERGGEVLFPVRLDEAVMNARRGWPAFVRKTRHIGDFRNWREPGEYRQGFKRLLDDLRLRP